MFETRGSLIFSKLLSSSLQFIPSDVEKIRYVHSNITILPHGLLHLFIFRLVQKLISEPSSTPRTIKSDLPNNRRTLIPTRHSPIREHQVYTLKRNPTTRRRSTTRQTRNRIRGYRALYVLKSQIFDFKQRRAAVSSYAAECRALGDAEGC